MTGTYLARREREALCDLALEVGPEAPTLCGDWTVRDLITHLLIRERSLLGAPGIVVPALGWLTEQRMARLRRRTLDRLVGELRSPGLTPLSLPPLDRLANTLEYVVHHEDIRRARPTWEPRTLPRADRDAIWRALTWSGRGLVRSVGVAITIRRDDADPDQSDQAGPDQADQADQATAELRAGPDPVEICGAPVELAMFLFGRAQHRGLHLSGPDDSVAKVRAARLGV